MKSRFTIQFAILLFLFFSCKNTNRKDHQVSQGFLDSLTELQIGQLSYHISVPANYVIKESEGPDFSVFYFADADTTVVSDLSGGIYFGNHPRKFPPDDDSCKVETIDSEILGEINLDYIPMWR